ncbi:MAG: hypothetical protein OK456_01705 [Thaumarchaeota archaeon]|nr:hypothetical protein [Nitrososphaerota archaeon]
MTKVTFKPYEELVIHEYQKFVLDDMVKLRSIGMQVGSIAPNFQWSDGLAMWKEAFPQNEEMTKENLEGRIHWLWLACAEMPEYKPSLTFKETSIVIPVMNVSDNPVFSGAAKWLKEQK